MTATDLLVWALVVLPAFDWAVALILGWLSHRHPRLLTLRERFVTALMLACIATIAAVLGLVRFGVVPVTNAQAISLLLLAMFLASVPAVVWLGLLVTGRFRLPDRREDER